MLVLACCHHDLGEVDTAFFTWDNRQVHCAVNIDTYARVEQPSIETGLDRARDTGQVLELYTHDPGRTIEWAALEAVLAAATSRGLAYVTYADMAHGVKPAGGGLALGFDDAYVPDWMTARDMFMRYGARVTFFITYWDQLNETDRMSLHVLAADGHDIEAHSVKHRRGPDYVEASGLGTYIADEVQPSIDHLVDDGFEITTYAYPFGARTGETDQAILGRVQQLRSVTYTWDSPAIDPCPN